MFEIQILNGKSYKTIGAKNSVLSAFDFMTTNRGSGNTYRIRVGKRIVGKWSI